MKYFLNLVDRIFTKENCAALNRMLNTLNEEIQALKSRNRLLSQENEALKKRNDSLEENIKELEKPEMFFCEKCLVITSGKKAKVIYGSNGRYCFDEMTNLGPILDQRGSWEGTFAEF